MLVKKGQKLVAVINMDVPDPKLIERATGRRIHPASGRAYHVTMKPPKVADKDDVTGEALVQRDDDKEETMKKRLEEFRKNNEPILKFYEEQKIVTKVKGEAKVEEVWTEIEKVMKTIA